MTATNNTFVGGGKLVQWYPSSTPQAYLWDNNRYYGGQSAPFSLNATLYDFAGWKAATGFDSQSTYSTAYPTGVKVVVRPNKYEAGRANIAVYNWDLRGTVSVDVSGVLTPGAYYEVRDAQNFYGAPVASGT